MFLFKLNKKNKRKNCLVSHSDLLKLFYYDPKTGLFIRKVTMSSNAKAGSIAGTKVNGYVALYINRTRYYAHRLAWFYVYGVWPKDKLDHKNLNKSDNRIKNLREATHKQNMHNMATPIRNTTGYKGTSYHKKVKKFTAQININGKLKHLGCFNTAEDAHKVYVNTAKKYHKDFYCSL